ncbi:OB-fold-containig protein [Cypionkella sp.]|uniref:OB-fold-containig protein n=1 Tax=Cypionkella sp. TaxID=2811411 RepID=UPI002AB821C3|nr:OB-fold-containig protein [Cypionkella sp.]MDZ4392701.1 DUF1449 family protein [Cypionkella sp.]
MHFLLVEQLRPFSVLAGFIVVLLIIEIALTLLGLSSNIEIDGADHGLEFEHDFDPQLDLQPGGLHEGLMTAHELATLDLPPARIQSLQSAGPSLASRLMRLVGIGRGPLLVSLTCIAAGVSACGYFLQLALQGLVGAMLPAGIAFVIVVIPGLLLGGRLAAVAARMIPSFESHAISGQTYNGRRGHIVIGDARRGEPAQVRWRDMYGTTHSLMAEPLRDDEIISAGTEVLIVKTRERQPRIISVSQG